MPFFDLFPTIIYDIERDGLKKYQLVNDIFFRAAFIKEIKNKKLTYYSYRVTNGDTPDIVAAKIYNDPQLHWVILLLNDIVDPHSDWTMGDGAFSNYIEDKYGSIADAYNTVHHIEKKTIYRTIDSDGQNNDVVFFSQVDNSDLLDTISGYFPNLPYDSWDGPHNLSTAIQLQGGNSVTVIEQLSEISCFDYEFNLNQQKSIIKLVYPETIEQIKTEFDNLVAKYNPTRRFGLKSARL